MQRREELWRALLSALVDLGVLGEGLLAEAALEAAKRLASAEGPPEEAVKRFLAEMGVAADVEVDGPFYRVKVDRDSCGLCLSGLCPLPGIVRGVVEAAAGRPALYVRSEGKLVWTEDGRCVVAVRLRGGNAGGVEG